jgi:hypothetical protein
VRRDPIPTLRRAEFDYAIKSAGSKKRFSVDYMDLDPEVMEETEQSNTWWRNVGVAWLVIGGFLTAFRYGGDDGLRISFWLYLGVVCLAIYRFGRTTFTHHAIGRSGQILLIKDRKASSILDELTARRRRRLADVYGEIDFDEDPEREVAKFRFLESQGAFSSEEAAAKISAIRAAEADAPEEATPVV